ncbi:MAG: ribonuclease P protein component [Prevotella sp.]|nr:ribonuclease P protein component [Prevotella sp.]
MSAENFTFPKRERIVSQKTIDELFSGDHSHSAVAYPVRAVFMLCPRQPGGEAVQVLMSVPKRRLKHAVDRNRVKRQLREAWRLQQAEVLGDALPADQSLRIAFVWLQDGLSPTAVVASRMHQLLERIGKKL